MGNTTHQTGIARALFPEPVKCTGALGAGAAEAKARTEKMPQK